MSYVDRISRQISRLGKLPLPEQSAIIHSEKLDKHLQQIANANQGELSFEQFMQQVLYAPGLGYYSAGAEKIGESGDFITAPEISPFFSDCLAQQIEQVLRLTGGSVLEFGAGRGTMAADILTRLEEIECLPEKYYILEISAELQQRQQLLLAEQIPHLFERLVWLNKLPSNFTGVIVANEVVDAMPVKVFYKQGKNFLEKMISHSNDGWQWNGLKQSTELQQYCEQLEATLGYELQQGYESEVNLMQKSWLHALSKSLDRGLILLIDYGFPQLEYYHPQRPGTLMCHYRHYSHTDPLVLIGLQDVTAHVDFTALAEQALESELQVKGYTDQGTFLTNCGILQRMEQLSGIDDAKIVRYSQQVKLLILPTEMGELFKLIAFGRGLDEMDLIGFSTGDRRSRL